MEILSFPRCSIYDQISPMLNQSKQFYNFSKHQSYFEEYGNIENMSCCKSPKIYLLCFLVCCNLVRKRIYIKLEQQRHRQTNCPVKKCRKQFQTQSESNDNYQVIDLSRGLHAGLKDFLTHTGSRKYQELDQHLLQVTSWDTHYLENVWNLECQCQCQHNSSPCLT